MGEDSPFAVRSLDALGSFCIHLNGDCLDAWDLDHNQDLS